MRWSIALSFVALGAVSGIADEPIQWKEFVSKEGRYKVLMPGTPPKVDSKGDAGKNDFKMNTVPVGNAVYGAGHLDFRAKVKYSSAKQFYDEWLQSNVATVAGKVASDQEIKLGKYPGREVQIIHGEDGLIMRTRLFLVGQRFYQLLVVGTKEEVTSKDADKFLDSFRLTDSGISDESIQWKEFLSKEGRFKVLMPGTPEPPKANNKNDAGKNDLKLNTVSVGSTVYSAGHVDLPAMIKDSSVMQTYDRWLELTVAKLGGKVISDKEIKLGKHSGCEVLYDIQDVKTIFRIRLFLIGQRLYQLNVIGPKDEATSKDADKFLDSFNVTGK